MKKTITILAFLILTIHCFAQMEVTAALDSTTILLGDQVKLNFKTTHPLRAEYLSADFKAAFDTLDQVELIEVGEPYTKSIGTTQDVVTQSIIITSFKDGTHAIPGILFSSKLGDQTYQNLSNVVYLKVQAIDIDTTKTELMPIKDIMEEPVRLSDWIYYILIPLAILFVFSLIIFLLRKLSKKKQPVLEEEKKIYIPPHIIALDKLKELKEKELWQKGEVKAYYSEISYIAREYLENRFQINALESVTHEIIPELKNKGIPETLQRRLIDTLRTADLVKFAKVKPNEETHESVIKRVEQLIEETKIAPAPTPKDDLKLEESE